MAHQSRAHAPAPVLGIDQDHRDPRHGPENARRQRAHGVGINRGHETTVRLEIQIATPVRFGLIPAVGCLQTHSQRQVRSCHEADVNHVRPQAMVD